MRSTHCYVARPDVSRVLEIHRQADHGTVQWRSPPSLKTLSQLLYDPTGHHIDRIKLTGGGCWVTQQVSHWTRISPQAIVKSVPFCPFRRIEFLSRRNESSQQKEYLVWLDVDHLQHRYSRDQARNSTSKVPLMIFSPTWKKGKTKKVTIYIMTNPIH